MYKDRLALAGVTSMILAAALSVALPLIGHDKVVSAVNAIDLYDTSVGCITLPVKGLIKLMSPPLLLDDRLS
jgi:hypothetical protein